jgi:hypothetical protein
VSDSDYMPLVGHRGDIEAEREVETPCLGKTSVQTEEAGSPANLHAPFAVQMHVVRNNVDWRTDQVCWGEHASRAQFENKYSSNSSIGSLLAGRNVGSAGADAVALGTNSGTSATSFTVKDIL